MGGEGAMRMSKQKRREEEASVGFGQFRPMWHVPGERSPENTGTKKHRDQLQAGAINEV